MADRARCTAVTERLLLSKRSVREIARYPEATIPFERLTPVMEALARANPVSYVIEGLRSLVIEGWDPDKLAAGVGVTAAMGIVLTALSLRAIATYDR